MPKKKIQLNDSALENIIKPYRTSSKSDGAYPILTQYTNIWKFLKKYGKVITSNNVKLFCDEDEKYHKYYLINKMSDILTDTLSGMPFAYDSMVDRYLTWYKEPYRVGSYEESLIDATHVGTICILDLEQNVHSLRELLLNPEFASVTNELYAEIDYWESYLYEKDRCTIRFKYYVIAGKNRACFAIPRIYESHIKNGDLESIANQLSIDIKVWTKYVTRSYKIAIYRNEKNNQKDTSLQYLIGYGGPLTRFIFEYPKKKIPSMIFPKLFEDKQLLMIKDRELIIDAYAAYCGEYGSSNVNDWIAKQFIQEVRIKNDFEKSLDYYMEVLLAWDTLRSRKELTRYPMLNSSHSWRILLFALCNEIVNSKLSITVPEPELYNTVISTALETRTELESEDIVYGYLSKGTPLKVKELMSGLKSSDCIYDVGFNGVDDNFIFKFYKNNPAKYPTMQKGYQFHVMTTVFFTRFWHKLAERNQVARVANRKFTVHSLSSLARRDGYMVRINGEVYDTKNNVVKFSNEFPNDPYILQHGANVDYVQLPYSKITGEDIEVDHIPAYIKNKTVDDLSQCELTTGTYNNWKNNRDAVYQNDILRKIKLR